MKNIRIDWALVIVIGISACLGIISKNISDYVLETKTEQVEFQLAQAKEQYTQLMSEHWKLQDSVAEIRTKSYNEGYLTGSETMFQLIKAMPNKDLKALQKQIPIKTIGRKSHTN